MVATAFLPFLEVQGTFLWKNSNWENNPLPRTSAKKGDHIYLLAKGHSSPTGSHRPPPPMRAESETCSAGSSHSDLAPPEVSYNGAQASQAFLSTPSFPSTPSLHLTLTGTHNECRRSRLLLSPQPRKPQLYQSRAPKELVGSRALDRVALQKHADEFIHGPWDR